ncbi:MAG TPA: universal stress protein [Flavobacterium sp.]|uniref:universal stress protein n=1 Tax=Flavobacterium sp. TaxID=239 RepID=UPI002F3E22F1
MDKIKKILIAIDNDPAAEKIALHGLQLALQLKAEIALLSVIDSTMLETQGAVTPQEFSEIIKNDYKKLQQMLIDTVFKGHEVWTFLEEGKPHEVIFNVAQEWDADVIVLGTHGRIGISHLIMGSVAEKVIRHSKKPVLIIPTRL